MEKIGTRCKSINVSYRIKFEIKIKKMTEYFILKFSSLGNNSDVSDENLKKLENIFLYELSNQSQIDSRSLKIQILDSRNLTFLFLSENVGSKNIQHEIEKMVGKNFKLKNNTPADVSEKFL